MIPTAEVADELAFAEDRARQIVDYLVGERLLERRGLGGLGELIALTHYGVTEVEAALAAPRRGTDHFPFQVINNVLIAEKIERSQVQMGAVDSTQTMNTADLDAVRELVRELRAAIAELEFVDDATATNIAADLDSLGGQLGRAEPKPGMIRELLTSLRHTLEGAGGGVLAEQADKVGDLVEKIEQVTRSLPG